MVEKIGCQMKAKNKKIITTIYFDFLGIKKTQICG
jgi:hypothetical protein